MFARIFKQFYENEGRKYSNLGFMNLNKNLFYI